MNTRSRIALGVSAALVSFSFALAPSFAQDKMMKGDSMKKEDTMSKDAMKKDDGMASVGDALKSAMRKKMKKGEYEEEE